MLDYINRSYRDPVPRDSGFPSQPTYVVDGGRIGRLSNPAQDVKLVQTASLLRGRRGNSLEEQARASVDVIKHYSQTTLAKFLFQLPAVIEHHRAIAQGNKATILVEQLLIDVDKGIENVLLEIWDELKDGECFDDTTVTRKLLSIVESAKH